MPSELPPPAQSYEHRPKPFSNALSMTIKGPVLHAERGAREQDYPLAEIAFIRLAYSPRNTQRMGFSCFFRMKDGRSLTFSNLDWRSMVENARQDAPYTGFVRELVMRAAKANPKLALLAGLPGWRHTLFTLGALVILPAMALGAAYFAAEKNWPLTALAGGLTVWLGFYAQDYWKRNRPRSFEPAAIPDDVLPPAP